MPLVVLNVEGNIGYPHNVDADSVTLDAHTFTLNLPREAYNKRWTLRSVKALHVNRGSRLRWVEIGIPQLMPEDHVHYHLEVDPFDADSIPPPPKRLRFYPNRVSCDQTQFDSSYGGVNIAPNINLGVHRLDRSQLEIVVNASTLDTLPTGLVSFECILEYD